MGMQPCPVGMAPARFIFQRLGAIRWRLLEVDVEVGMQSCRVGIALDRFIFQRFGVVRWRLLEVDVE